MSIRIDRDKCIRCGACREVCPGNLIRQAVDGTAYLRHPEECWGCASCLKECRHAKVGVLGLAFFVNDMFYFLITGLEKDVVTTLFVTRTVPECIYTVVIGGILFYLTSGKKSNV